MTKLFKHNRLVFLPELLLIIGFIVITGQEAHSQFLDLNLNVDSELSATTLQPLEFGTLSPNSGRVEIPLGAANMGIFSIRALENQNLLVTLDIPEELPHENPAVDQAIPLYLQARYGYSAQDYQVSTPLPEAASSIIVASTSSPGPWSLLYIFIYGSLDLGGVPDGNYSDEILLNVEYL